MTHVYCISGLGADEKIFSRLQWPADVQVHYVQWLQPEKDEPISTYARRLSDTITEPDPVLMGASFGGIMSIEISQLIPVKKIILVSSITNDSELPAWMRFCGKYHLDYIIPKRGVNKLAPLKIFYPVQNYFLGAESPDARQLASEYRGKVDPVYLKWAVNKILNWRSPNLSVPFVQIHGNKDKLFPISMVKPTYTVDNTGHFLIYQKPTELSQILQQVL